MNNCDNYRHTIEVVVTTQFPQIEGFEELVKTMLGPWCTSVKLIRTTAKDEEYK